MSDESSTGSNPLFRVPMDPDDKSMERIRKFDVRNSDIFLIGFPKSGTTWAQEMVWMIANNLDFEASRKFIDERFPVLELFTLIFDELASEVERPYYHTNSLDFIEQQKDPRFIKTHLGWDFLPNQIKDGTKKPKIIYIYRNVKDTCLSMYHYLKDLLNVFDGTLDQFCKSFIADFGRSEDLKGSYYWSDVLAMWNKRNESNILFIRYEDMKRNLSQVIEKVAEFLERPLTKDQVTTLIRWLDFDSIKNNPAVNHDELYKKSGFVRSGKVGGYKEEMSADLIEMFDTWTQKHLHGTDFVL